jgi:hypothetical protein
MALFFCLPSIKERACARQACASSRVAIRRRGGGGNHGASENSMLVAGGRRALQAAEQGCLVKKGIRQCIND